MHIRRNVYALSPDGPRISAFKAGVRAMKDRPQSSPRSWAYQAAIHGSYRTPPDVRARRTWNKCQHASFFFLSWHRMYIYFFERILRAASGDPDLALPYWNYSNPAQRALPLPFRDTARSSNPLYVTQRSTGINGGARLPQSGVAFAPAFRVHNFLPREGSRLSFGGGRIQEPAHFSRFTGALENQPHNDVHNLVGGNSGWMGDPNTAAQDPIFWLHHSNIDRLRERWLDLDEGRANPVRNNVWMDTEFTFFDEHGDEVKMSGRDIVRTGPQLDYHYDDEPAGAASVAAAARVGGAEAVAEFETPGGGTERKILGSAGAEGGEEMIELGAAPTRVVVELEETVGGEERIVLGLDGVQYDESPGITYEVYLNLPEGEEPEYTNDYYVGNVGFFGMESHGHEGGGHGPPALLSFDVTDVIRTLKEKGEWDESRAEVSFFARGLIPADAEETTRTGSRARPEPAGRPRVERVVLSTE